VVTPATAHQAYAIVVWQPPQEALAA
jgi:hypothetical protein